MRHPLLLGATALMLLSSAAAPALAQEHEHEHEHDGGGHPAAPAARPAPASPAPGGGRGPGGPPPGFGGRYGAPTSGAYAGRGQGAQGPQSAPGAGGYAGAGQVGRGAPVAPGSGGYAGRGYGGARPQDGGYAPRPGGPGGPGGYGQRGPGGYGGGGYAGGGRAFSYHGRSFSAFRARPYVFPSGYGYRRYGLHARLPLVFLTSTWFLSDWAAYDLGPPPSPEFRWVRYGPDALLVDVYSGEVVDAAYGVFDDGGGAYGYGAPYGPPPPYPY